MYAFPNLNSADACHRLCQGIPLCEAWTHHESSQDCGLHTADENMSGKTAKKAGARECPGKAKLINVYFQCRIFQFPPKGLSGASHIIPGHGRGAGTTTS